jgi:hypothetical protein
MSKSEMLQAAAANPYYIPAYVKGQELRRRDFEKEVAKVDLKKYHATQKDAQRVYAAVSGDKRVMNGLWKVTDPKKAFVRYIMGLRVGKDWDFLKREAIKGGITEAEVEAYARAYAGVSMSTFALLPQEAKKVKLEYQKKLKSYSPSSWFEMMY